MQNTRPLQLILMTITILLNVFKLPAQEIDQEVISILNTMDYNYFFEHLTYLASDELQGRGIGSKGYSKAADYVAKEFKNNGLLPFGDSGTYFQEVMLSKPSVQEHTFKFQIEKDSKTIFADYGSDVTVVLSPKYHTNKDKLEMVFVGYGNIVADENINDYKGLDVKGKIAIVALGGPKGILNPAFNDRQAKFDNAIAKGAAGIILFYPKAGLFQNLIFKRVHGYLSGRMLFLADTTISDAMTQIDLRLPVFSKKGFIRDIFKLNGLSLKKTLSNMKKGNFSSRKLKSILRYSYNLQLDSIKSRNIVAVLGGSSQNLKNEYVVLGSHLDGLGIGKAIKGDSIYNGMLDNASGVSALLSISKSFGLLTKKPKKSIVFVCFTGEETGLLGSSYFVNRNNISNGKIIANINIDMLAQSFESKDMAPLGQSHSNLSVATNYVGNILNLGIDDNKQAEKAYIERSDQISFIKKGIPSLYISGGLTAVDDSKSGEKIFNKWMKQTYSSPFDDLEQEYSEKAFLNAIKFNFLTVYHISYFMENIQWNTDGWLYRKYIGNNN